MDRFEIKKHYLLKSANQIIRPDEHTLLILRLHAFHNHHIEPRKSENHSSDIFLKHIQFPAISQSTKDVKQLPTHNYIVFTQIDYPYHLFLDLVQTDLFPTMSHAGFKHYSSQSNPMKNATINWFGIPLPATFFTFSYDFHTINCSRSFHIIEKLVTLKAILR